MRAHAITHTFGNSMAHYSSSNCQRIKTQYNNVSGFNCYDCMR